jgi:hypothetical protein
MALPKVSFTQALTLGHLGGRPRGDKPAKMQGDDSICQPHNYAHVMLDDQQGDVVGAQPLH